MTVHIKEIIKDFLKQQEQKNTEIELVESAIKELLEKNWKEYVVIKEIKDNIIVFRTQSAGVRYGLHLKKDQLLKNIRVKLPKIKDIKIVLN